MALKLRIAPGDIRKLEAALVGGARALRQELQGVIRQEMDNWARGLIRAIQSDARFEELRNNDDLRGVLGMPQQRFRKGSDTDAGDLIKLLRTYEIKTTKTIRTAKTTVSFPSIEQLQNKLTRNLSSISSKGAVVPGKQQSWFKWWEFGDKGEITSLTVFRRTIGQLSTGSSSSKARSRASLTKLITQRSRSGSALQIPSKPRGPGGGISGRGLVTEKYTNFGRILPARLGKAVKSYASKNQGRIARLFSRIGAI